MEDVQELLESFWSNKLDKKPKCTLIVRNGEWNIVIEDNRSIIFLMTNKKQIYAVPKSKCYIFNVEEYGCNVWIIEDDIKAKIVNCGTICINSYNSNYKKIADEILPEFKRLIE
jgi:hypothetical protein